MGLYERIDVARAERIVARIPTEVAHVVVRDVAAVFAFDVDAAQANGAAPRGNPRADHVAVAVPILDLRVLRGFAVLADLDALQSADAVEPPTAPGSRP